MVESAVQQSASDRFEIVIVYIYNIYIYMYHLLQRVYPYRPVQHSDLRLHQRTWFCQAFAPTATTFARTSALLIEKRNTMCIGLQGRKNKYALFWPCRFFYAAGTTAQIQVKVGHEHLHLNKAEHFRPGLGRVPLQLKENILPLRSFCIIFLPMEAGP